MRKSLFVNKSAIIEKIIAVLDAELAAYAKSARAAHEEATHEQSKAGDKYDTRELAASYLAHGQAQQMTEMEAAIHCSPRGSETSTQRNP